MLLEVEGLCVNYGHIEAIRDISFSVEEGAIDTLIGANGAGKTTTLKTISGLHKVRAGSIRFDGREITGTPPYDRVKMGISQAPEGRGVFPGMTVRENLEMGAFVRTDRKSQAYADDLARVLTSSHDSPSGQPAGGQAVRWGTADAVHRSLPDGPSAAGAAGRAVDGPGADADPAHLLGDQ